MKIIDYMNKLEKTENGENHGLEDLLIDDELDVEEDDDLFFPIPSIWGKRNKKEEEIFQQYSQALGDISLTFTPFRDASFFRTFLSDIPKEEQLKYIYHTALYYEKKKDYDPKYVLITRRSLPRLEDKPEQFWSSEYVEVMNGLSYEIPKESPHRLHSVILVSTLEKLEKYGFATNYGGVTDGEIMIQNTPFSRDDLLFIHKSNREIMDLMDYLHKGGMKNEEVFEELKKVVQNRQNHYNGK